MQENHTPVQPLVGAWRPIGPEGAAKYHCLNWVKTEKTSCLSLRCLKNGSIIHGQTIQSTFSRQDSIIQRPRIDRLNNEKCLLPVSLQGLARPTIWSVLSFLNPYPISIRHSQLDPEAGGCRELFGCPVAKWGDLRPSQHVTEALFRCSFRLWTAYSKPAIVLRATGFVPPAIARAEQ